MPIRGVMVGRLRGHFTTFRLSAVRDWLEGDYSSVHVPVKNIPAEHTVKIRDLNPWQQRP